MENKLLDVARGLGRTLGINFHDDLSIIEEFEKVKDQKIFFNTLIRSMFKLYKISINNTTKKEIIPIREEIMSFLLEKIEGEKQFEIFKDIVLAFMLTSALEKNTRRPEMRNGSGTVTAIS